MDYKDALYFMTHNGATSSEETVSYQMMVEAMEKQIPKKPIDYDYVLPVYDRDGYQVDAIFMYKARCPSCGEIIADGELEKSDMAEEKYCRNCGQRIDWSEVE